MAERQDGDEMVWPTGGDPAVARFLSTRFAPGPAFPAGLSPLREPARDSAPQRRSAPTNPGGSKDAEHRR